MEQNKELIIAQSAWGSYPKIYAIGHRALKELFSEEVIVEEKIDGSQFSFGVFDSPDGPLLKMKSKGAALYESAPEKMFAEAVNYVSSIQHRLQRNWRYVGEYLKKPKHNSLIYNRAPHNHIIIFDICVGEEIYLPYLAKKSAAEAIGLETVPVLYCGKVENIADFRNLLDHESVLGGAKIEGFVAKNYARFGLDGKALMGKFVSEEFKEIHSKAWGESNPTQGGAVDKIGLQYQTQARWLKAVQHLRDSGTLLQEPKDIGNLIKEVKRDVSEECKEEIKDQLWKAFGEKVIRIAGAGLPQWYKEGYLVKKQFEEG